MAASTIGSYLLCGTCRRRLMPAIVRRATALIDNDTPQYRVERFCANAATATNTHQRATNPFENQREKLGTKMTITASGTAWLGGDERCARTTNNTGSHATGDAARPYWHCYVLTLLVRMNRRFIDSSHKSYDECRSYIWVPNSNSTQVDEGRNG